MEMPVVVQQGALANAAGSSREAGVLHAACRTGTMVIRPYGYALWEAIQSHLDKRFKEVRAAHTQDHSGRC